MQDMKDMKQLYHMSGRRNNALNLLISATLSKVDHRLPELLFTNTAVVVIVKRPEGCLHVIQLVAAVPQDLLPNSKEV